LLENRVQPPIDHREAAMVLRESRIDRIDSLLHSSLEAPQVRFVCFLPKLPIDVAFELRGRHMTQGAHHNIVRCEDDTADRAEIVQREFGEAPSRRRRFCEVT